MNQINAPARFHPLILGSGKVARHLHHYLNLKNIPHDHWPSARVLSDEFYRLASKASFIWILVSDRAIEALYQEISKKLTKMDFVHASGGLSIPGVHTLHPLMTFGPELYELAHYEKTPFTVIEEEVRDEPQALVSFFEHLPNPKHSISATVRGLYHADCVMLANFPQILWSGVLAQIANQVSEAPEQFIPLLEQSVENFLKYGDQALTGPLVREDQVTIEKHMNVLGRSPLGKLYQAFVQYYPNRQSTLTEVKS